MKEIASIIQLWKELDQLGQPAALASLVRVSGSHYRKPGAKMLFAKDGKRAGSISGGCLEADLFEHAVKVMTTGQSILVKYDTSVESDLLLGTGMGCGGIVEILVEPISCDSVRQFLSILESSLVKRTTSIVATVYRVKGSSGNLIGSRIYIQPDGLIQIPESLSAVKDKISPTLQEIQKSRSFTNKVFMLGDTEVELFIEPIHSAISLLLCGAGDDAVSLYKLAKTIGWEISVVDQRAELLTDDRFPDACFVHDTSAGTAVSKLDLKDYDAVVIMTHNYYRDLEILRHLKKGSLRYIGLLGAAKRSEKLLRELAELEAGSGEQQKPNNLYAPVGLDIGAEGSDEIAISIIAEIKAVLSHKEGGSLRIEPELKTDRTNISIHNDQSGAR